MRATSRGTEDDVLRKAGDVLNHMGLSWTALEKAPASGAARPDGILRIQSPQGPVDLVFEVKIRPRKDELGAVLRQFRRYEQPCLLVADYINPQLADWLRDREVMFVDAAGNAHLRTKSLFVWVTGQRDELRLQVERERRRALQPSGLRLVFALLCRPGLVESDYRTLAGMAGVALGTVQWVVRDLIQEGYVLRIGRRRRRLVEPKALLDVWTPAFLRSLRPRLLLGRFEAREISWWSDLDLRAYGALWGGEPAAARLTRFLKPGTLTLYADKIPGRLIAERKLRMDDAGRVEIRRKFWRFDEKEKADTVPPILVYADLQAIGDSRAQEAAERVFRQEIDGLIHQHLARRPH